jgi:hypothetical protein
MKCPGCGEWFDMRDLGQVLAHFHDADIESPEVLRRPAIPTEDGEAGAPLKTAR